MNDYACTKLKQWDRFKSRILKHYYNTDLKKYEIDDFNLQEHLDHYISNINQDDPEIPIIISIFACDLYKTLVNHSVTIENYLDHISIHIYSYVIPQYGDFPDKTVAKFSIEKIQGKLEAYIDRIVRSSRGLKDELIDSLKIGHFCCYLYYLIINNDAQSI